MQKESGKDLETLRRVLEDHENARKNLVASMQQNIEADKGVRPGGQRYKRYSNPDSNPALRALDASIEDYKKRISDMENQPN